MAKKPKTQAMHELSSSSRETEFMLSNYDPALERADVVLPTSQSNPKYTSERKAKIVFGVDECGRGSLAGEVDVCAICIPISVDIGMLVNDSKLLNEKQRNATSHALCNNGMIHYVICNLDHEAIDKMNILSATKDCMFRSCLLLAEQLYESDKSLQSLINQDALEIHVLIDGNVIPSEFADYVKPANVQRLKREGKPVFDFHCQAVVKGVSKQRIRKRVPRT